MELSRFQPRWRWVLATVWTVGCVAPTALAQQFVEQNATRFPVQPATDYTNQATVGDLDGDGDLDIVWANGCCFNAEGATSPMRIYINDGNGFFTDETDARADNANGWFRGVELGDADNDGDLDIVLAQDFNKRPNLLINDGAGVFQVEGPARLPGTPLSSSRGQFGDVDNDGDLDLFFTSGTSSRFSCGQYRVYLNNGLGFYTDATATNFPAGAVCNNMDCIFGDIDGDFDIDIRTASTGSNNSRLYRNDGTGVFQTIASPSDSSCYSYDFGDIDGDGDLDLLGANGGTGTTEILLANNGNGGYTNVSGQIAGNPSLDDNDTKFFDYDNDGDLDYVIARLGGPDRIYQNNGAGFFSVTAGVIQSVSESSLDVVVADFNGDGAYDIITASGESLLPYTNLIYINNGPADTIAPNIISTEQLDDTKDDLGPYVVRTAVLDHMTSDRNFFDKGIFLNYTVDDGPVQQATMRYSGGQIYRGEIPGQPFGSAIDYWITANDWNNNMATGPTLSFNVLGEVICLPDFNGDMNVDAADLALLLGNWGACAGCPEDIDGSGTVDAADLALLLGGWGPC